MLNEVRAQRGGNAPKDVYVISMGVDTELFHRSTSYEPWRRGQQLWVFCCGRIDHGKGQIDLVELSGKLQQRGIACRCRIAGNVSNGAEEYLEEVKRLMVRLNVQHQIEFLGPIPEPQVKEELNRAHLFLLPSQHEPLGVAYMEAMAMEVPTIGYRSGGVPELIDDRQNGLLAEPGSVDSLVEAVEWVIADPRRARAIGVAARQRVVERYRSDHGAKLLADALRNAIATHAGRKSRH